MSMYKKEVKGVNPESSLKLVVDSGYACSGEVVIEPMIKSSNEVINTIDVDLTEGKSEILLAPQNLENFAITGFGKLESLPGKSEKIVIFELYADDKEVLKFDIRDDKFQFIIYFKNS